MCRKLLLLDSLICKNVTFEFECLSEDLTLWQHDYRPHDSGQRFWNLGYFISRILNLLSYESDLRRSKESCATWKKNYFCKNTFDIGEPGIKKGRLNHMPYTEIIVDKKLLLGALVFCQNHFSHFDLW